MMRKLTVRLGLWIATLGGWHVPRSILIHRCLFVDTDSKFLAVVNEDTGYLEIADYTIMTRAHWEELVERHGIVTSPISRITRHSITL